MVININILDVILLKSWNFISHAIILNLIWHLLMYSHVFSNKQMGKENDIMINFILSLVGLRVIINWKLWVYEGDSR